LRALPAAVREPVTEPETAAEKMNAELITRFQRLHRCIVRGA
jgi:hypothetical protein